MMGGGLERVSASMFDDPLGLNDTDNDEAYCEGCDNFLEDCKCSDKLSR